MKLNFELFGREYGLMALTRNKTKQPVAGVTNRTKDGYYVLFLDYDGMPLDWVMDELAAIGDEYRLGDVMVFKSSADHYHVVGFDKLTRDEYQSILNRSSCDPQYKKVPFTWGRRVATLRATPKNGRDIEYVTRGEAPLLSNTLREKSSAHRTFFEGRYGIKAPQGRYDNEEELIIARYTI